jgi:hypothetical protein
MSINELPKNLTAAEFDEIRKCFHYTLKMARCPLPACVHKYIIWLEDLAKAGLQDDRL